MGRLLLIGAEHLNALRDQVFWALAGAATYVAFGDTPAPWLDIEGITPPQRPQSTDNFWGRLVEKIGGGELDPTSPAAYVTKHRPGNWREYYLGRVRGGGGDAPGESGWTNGPEFILRAGLVFTLGALEQFERDVLKVLLACRPAGQPRKPAEQVLEPSAADLESDPQLWVYFEKPAQNQVERQRIFKNVFGFEPYPLRKELESFYDIRNEVAHGRSPTLVKLSAFARCMQVAFECMRHLSAEAETKQHVLI